MDEQLYLLAVGLSLEEKVEKAILTIQHYEHEALKKDPDGGYYSCDSYGKDSCVIMELMRLSGVLYLGHHNLTTLDPPELIQFGRRFHPDTIVHKPEKPMLARMLEMSNGPPTRLARWCCEEYKESSGGNTVKVFGVRAAESPRRKSIWKTFQADRRNGGFILNPILYWSDEDVWRFINSNNIPYCCLYDPPFNLTRVGCVGCPMAGDKRVGEFRMWPRMGEAWKRNIIRFYDKWTGVPLQRPRTLPDGTVTNSRWFDLNPNINSGEDMFNWWMQTMPLPEDEGCQMGLF